MMELVQCFPLAAELPSLSVGEGFPVGSWLNITWFFLVGILLTGYAILDGFDLGVGSLHLLTRGNNDRRIMLNAIGPVWDGNEVWLVTGGGALFAAFPKVYASVFSGFYLAFILLLVALIFRAVAIEFRSKQPMGWWRTWWDISFSLSSIVSAILIGVALGNITRGVPLGGPPDYEYAGTFFTLLNPYSLLVGLTTLALFLMHGSIYVVLKTDGPLNQQARRWMKTTIPLFMVFYTATTIATLATQRHMLENLNRYPILYLIPVLSLLAILNIPRLIHKGKEFGAFVNSCLVMLGLMGTFALGIFPRLVPNISHSPDLTQSLTIYNASSSQNTLEVMFIIALLGMPFVIAYTVSIYWIFRGKVKLTPMSY